jgi:cold shock CspA family protein
VVIHGSIESFDDRRGDGRLIAENGERLYFHCVDIADGTRTIDVGERVTAERAVGHLGHDEAVKVTKQPAN